MSLTKAAEFISGGHEERIQRLEATASSTAVDVAEVATKLEYVSQQVSESHDDLSAKIDNGIGRLEKAVSALVPLSARLEKLEAREAKRVERFSLVKKVFLFGALPVTGAIANRFGDSIWTFLFGG